MPPVAVSIIESYQPYNAQNPALMKEHLLWQLNKLCNIDKHRRIPTDATIVDFNLPDFISSRRSPMVFKPVSRCLWSAEGFTSVFRLSLTLRKGSAIQREDDEFALEILTGVAYWTEPSAQTWLARAKEVKRIEPKGSWALIF